MRRSDNRSSFGLYLTSTRVKLPLSQRRTGRFRLKGTLLRRVSKIIAAGVVSAALGLTATACGSSSSDSNSNSDTVKGAGMAYDVGGRGDHSFNDSAARGLDKADKEFKLGTK